MYFVCMAGKRICFMAVLFLTVVFLQAQEYELPRVMFVNAPLGLRAREEPNLNSQRLGVLAHGERVVIVEFSEHTETIDGITNHWYKVKKHLRLDGYSYLYVWVFGGYVIDEVPLDIPTLFGRWSYKDERFMYMDFQPNGRFADGLEETSAVSFGTWTLEGDVLTLSYIRQVDIDEYTTIFEHGWTDIIILEIIDRNNINLIYPNNSVRRLGRCFNPQFS